MMTHINSITLVEERLDWLKYLEYEDLDPQDSQRALAAKTTLAQMKQFLRLSFGDQSDFYQNFNQLAFYYGENKRPLFIQNKEIAISILKNVLEKLQTTAV